MEDRERRCEHIAGGVAQGPTRGLYIARGKMTTDEFYELAKARFGLWAPPNDPLRDKTGQWVGGKKGGGGGISLRTT